MVYDILYLWLYMVMWEICYYNISLAGCILPGIQMVAVLSNTTLSLDID